ncbi:MAG: hypothetical protein ACTHJV_10430 [Rhizobiaceae bacterium]
MEYLKIGETIEIGGIRLICTCSISPEQYDAFAGDQPIGYLRLRHGIFTVAYPDADGELIYEASPKGDGCFEDDERAYFLTKAIQILKSRADAT